MQAVNATPARRSRSVQYGSAFYPPRVARTLLEQRPAVPPQSGRCSPFFVSFISGARAGAPSRARGWRAGNLAARGAWLARERLDARGSDEEIVGRCAGRVALPSSICDGSDFTDELRSFQV